MPEKEVVFETTSWTRREKAESQRRRNGSMERSGMKWETRRRVEGTVRRRARGGKRGYMNVQLGCG